MTGTVRLEFSQPGSLLCAAATATVVLRVLGVGLLIRGVL
jgi:hypothetical protein